MTEFNLSKYQEVLMDFEAMIPIKNFTDEQEGFGTFVHTDKIKEFIKRLKEDFLVKEYKDFEELVDKLTGDLK